MTALNIAAQWPMRSHDAQLLAVNTLVSVALMATAVVISTEQGRRSTVVAIGTASILWPLNWLNVWHAGPLPFISEILGPLAALLAVWGVLRYAGPWPRPWHRHAATGVILGTQGLSMLRPMVGTAGWEGYRSGTWWPDLMVAKPVFGVLSTAVPVSYAAASSAAAVAVALRVVNLRGPDRHSLLPVVWAVSLGAAVNAAASLAELLPHSEADRNLLWLIGAASIFGVPVAFLVAAYRRWVAREKIAELAVRLRLATRVDELRTALREALGDPSLEVLFDLEVGNDGRTGFVDAAGRSVPAPAPGGPDLVIEVRDDDDRLLALIVTDPTLGRHPAVTRPAARGLGLSVSNLWTQAAIRARIVEVAGSGARLDTAVATERRRVSNEVASGPRRHLQALEDRLDALLGTALDDDVARTLAEAKAEIPRVRDDLSALASGGPPVALAAAGLQSAVHAVVSGLPLPVIVDIPVDRYRASVEAAAYFLIAETLTNTAKHSGATFAHVRVTVDGTVLRVAVADDGCGGADADGHGLRGLRERVRALEGQFQVCSRPGGGTRVVAELPLVEPALQPSVPG